MCWTATGDCWKTFARAQSRSIINACSPPFTTTLVEIRPDRDACPLDLAQISNLFGWDR
jgi:hypothetical protein